MDDNRIQVACVSNARYLPHVATLMQSLAASNPPGNLTLTLLHDETVSPPLLAQLRDSAERLQLALTTIQPSDEMVRSLPPGTSYYPSLIWYRVLLPELLSSHDRVLYVDADTLVLQDLRTIWSTDLGDALVAAVAQPTERRHSLAALARIGLPADSGYFNSGVLLMNLRQMRDEKFAAHLIDVGRKQADEWSGSTHFRLPDQDALNLACAGRWVPLHAKWNCLASIFLSRETEEDPKDVLHFREAAASPAIVHFEGTKFAKPWNYRCIHPLRHLYLAYRENTPWPLDRLEGSGPVERVLGMLPVRVQVWVSRLKRLVLGKNRSELGHEEAHAQ